MICFKRVIGNHNVDSKLTPFIHKQKLDADFYVSKLDKHKKISLHIYIQIYNSISQSQ